MEEVEAGSVAAALGPGLAVLSGANTVPAFLTKLWILVEDPDTDQLICWSSSGTSFHVLDQARFSKEVLPKFFKHNNMASFVRQLNMYGFRKVVHLEQGGLLKPERDDTEFQHQFFQRGQQHLLELIKRKVNNPLPARTDDVKVDDVTRILTDVKMLKGKQETIDSKIVTMKHENEALWREVASLRQKHSQQQKLVNKLIQFLVSLVQSNRIVGMKRKLPLMLNDSSHAHSLPKYSRPFSVDSVQALLLGDGAHTSGPIISDITEVTSPAAQAVQEAVSQDVKPEPDLLPVDTPLSPTTFINSILQEEAPHSPAQPSSPAAHTSDPSPSSVAKPDNPVVLLSSTPPAEPSVVLDSPSRRCQTVACIDKTELSDHLDSIDSGLENLQNALNNQKLSFDTSPIMEFFSTLGSSGDLNLDFETLLSDHAPKEDDALSGKQLVQYTPTALSEPVSSLEADANLPLDPELFFQSEVSAADDVDDASLLSYSTLDSVL
ncbi:heat shock factor protein 1 [Synchiropus splendidus]|uniref:heat shock factor protein 1 n=1 Tax=Synchiropus splendidus TaxID=270530 RepID=UPI00237D8086|nr:heat shock factor protein 1 [Synchiropus splendidus]